MAHAKNHDYHILPPSIWPFISALSVFVMLAGAVLWMKDWSMFPFLIGLVGVLYSMFGWWRDVTLEANGNEHTTVIRIGLRMGFIMFLISEVFFFVGWFWSFFKHAIFKMPGAAENSSIELIDVWHLPLINTLILLLSGTFVTAAHHEISHGNGDNKKIAKLLMFAILLGASFTFFQGYEYVHAYAEGITMDSNTARSNFYMATGFHGFHVIVGTIFLLVTWFRARRNEFTKEAHLGFEAAAWYWHFVDVIWLFLFFAVYIWGGAR